jgi:UDP-glucose 4-epimerase
MASIDWSTPSSCAAGLRREVGRFIAARGDQPWRVAWCAGTGFVGADERALEVERAALAATLETLASALHPERGAFFFASSAGGVYAGVGTPPYDEHSPVRSLTAYGDAKLHAEAVVAEWSGDTRTSVLIGRITTLYGPGQNLAKPQGIISQVCGSYLSGRPSSIYVPLDTIRDYLFVADCARLVADGLSRLERERTIAGSLVVTKILASQRPITVGAVLGEMRRIFKGSARYVVAASGLSSVQTRDLSFRSRVWPELDRRTLTPLPVGVARTAADLLSRLQQGELANAAR